MLYGYFSQPHTSKSWYGIYYRLGGWHEIFNFCDFTYYDYCYQNSERKHLKYIISNITSNDELVIYTLRHLLKDKQFFIDVLNRLLDKKVKLCLIYQGEVPMREIINYIETNNLNTTKDISRFIRDIEDIDFKEKFEKLKLEYKQKEGLI